MALNSGKANQGKKTHESKPTSKLSGHKFITKPEGRNLGTKISLGGAESYVKKLGGAA